MGPRVLVSPCSVLVALCLHNRCCHLPSSLLWMELHSHCQSVVGQRDECTRTGRIICSVKWDWFWPSNFHLHGGRERERPVAGVVGWWLHEARRISFLRIGWGNPENLVVHYHLQSANASCCMHIKIPWVGQCTLSSRAWNKNCLSNGTY